VLGHSAISRMDDFKLFCCLRSIASFCGDYPVFEETSKLLGKIKDLSLLLVEKRRV
jgi:hypothetical protein